MNDTLQPEAQPAVAPAAGDAATESAPSGASAWRASLLPLLITVAALGLAVWVWHDSRGEIAALRQELAKRLADADVRSRESRLVAERLREAVAESQVKLGVLESRLADSQNQQIALEAMYQELSRNRDEWAYAEIEQSLFIASQQLQLAGNVRSALIALQNADARLQRMDRPHLTALRKALNRDIERLKAAPHVDTVAISARLDAVIGQMDGLPLAMEVRPQAEAPVAGKADAGANAWERFWREAWAELRQLVRVQHIDRPEVPLLAPPQSYFLRENLKLRLLGARLALVARDAASFKADLKAARDWLGRYYDTRNSSVASTLGLLRNLQEAEVSIAVPDITATLEAMHGIRLPRERGTR